MVTINEINKIIRVLIMSGEKITREKDFFVWDGYNCKVYANSYFDCNADYSNVVKVNAENGFVYTVFVGPNTNYIYKVSDHSLDVINIGRKIQELPKKYTNLINKLVKQFYDKNLTSWNQIESMAWEGFALAINSYDDLRSKMNFTQYAAFAIRNNILSCLDRELRTVKLSNYAQKKALQRGDSLFNTISIDDVNKETSKSATREDIMFDMVSDAKFDDGDVYEYIYSQLSERFSKRDCELFYKSFGLNNYHEHKGKELATEYNISESLVSQKVKKIIMWMRSDRDMCEMLSNLLK